MTLNLASLYVFAIAAAGMLALFARHNRKIGWVKQRNTFVSDLMALQAAWDEIDLSVSGRLEVKAATIPTETVAGFSLQLAQMHKALNRPTVHPVNTTVADREFVSTGK